MNKEFKKYHYKIIGKPLHPNKQKALFDMFDAWMNTGVDCRIESADWQILGEQGGEIIVENKHTQEKFTFVILESLGPVTE
jgi:hypothetical protein